MSIFHSPRRQFIKKTFLFLGSMAGANASGRASRPIEHAARGTQPRLPYHSVASEAKAPQPSEAKTSETFVFDAHLHCPSENGKIWQWHPVTKTFKEFAGYLEKTGVSRGIINSVRSQLAKTPAEFIEGNREVARYVEAYDGRFVGACVVNPLFIDESLREIEECRKRFGFVWVGELCNYTVPYEYTVKEFELLVEKTVELGMILDVHTELEEMEYIIEKFPEATLVFPHFGDGHEYDHIWKRIELVARNDNCYLDTSGYGHDRMGMLEYAVEKIGPDRILFGSDFSINDPSTVIARIKNSFLSEDQKRKVFSENLVALLARAEA